MASVSASDSECDGADGEGDVLGFEENAPGNVEYDDADGDGDLPTSKENAPEETEYRNKSRKLLLPLLTEEVLGEDDAEKDDVDDEGDAENDEEVLRDEEASSEADAGAWGATQCPARTW